jgi:hypothetical protein
VERCGVVRSSEASFIGLRGELGRKKVGPPEKKKKRERRGGPRDKVWAERNNWAGGLSASLG